jgi:hypothetical protein
VREARQIYLECCAKIADALHAEGFRWRKSRRDAVKEEADLTFRIWFQSSSRNLLLKPEGTTKDSIPRSGVDTLLLPLEAALSEIGRFGNISLIVHVSVHARSMKKWRSSLACHIRTDDLVAGTNIGHLAPARHWLNINLANPIARPARIQLVIELIRTIGFEYFERFRHPDKVISSLLQSNDPGMLDYMELEYAACYGSPAAGLAVLRKYLQQRPHCMEEYHDALNEYRKNGIPAFLHGRPGPRLARMALALALEQH